MIASGFLTLFSVLAQVDVLALHSSGRWVDQDGNDLAAQPLNHVFKDTVVLEDGREHSNVLLVHGGDQSLVIDVDLPVDAAWLDVLVGFPQTPEPVLGQFEVGAYRNNLRQKWMRTSATSKDRTFDRLRIDVRALAGTRQSVYFRSIAAKSKTCSWLDAKVTTRPHVEKALLHEATGALIQADQDFVVFGHSGGVAWIGYQRFIKLDHNLHYDRVLGILPPRDTTRELTIAFPMTLSADPVELVLKGAYPKGASPVQMTVVWKTPSGIERTLTAPENAESDRFVDRVYPLEEYRSQKGQLILKVVGIEPATLPWICLTELHTRLSNAAQPLE